MKRVDPIKTIESAEEKKRKGARAQRREGYQLISSLRLCALASLR